jgi:small subunit ribosomal protein S1
MAEARSDMEQSAQAQQGSFAALLSGEYGYAPLRRREIREARVVAIDGHQVVVDLGAKRDGVVPQRDLESLSKEVRSNLHVGDVVPVSVVDASHSQDTILVSLRRGLAQRDWLRAEQLLQSSEPYEGTVAEANGGGVIVPFGRLRGFVPNSHLNSVPRGSLGERLEQAKSDLVGRELTVVVIEVDRKRRKLILSERVAGRRRRQQLLDELTVGDVRTGTVCNIVSFGAFVDLGGIDGLVHISELDWRRVEHPNEVLGIGDELQVYVLSVDRERERIGLSRKRLLPDPWSLVVEGMLPGEVIDGTVTNVVRFGAFVDVGEGVEGLVHVSEMPDGDETRAALEVGSPVTVRVIKIDSWKRRMALSMRHVQQASPLH